MKKYHVVSAKRMGWDNGDRTYEYEGETFYSIQYSGIADESEING